MRSADAPACPAFGRRGAARRAHLGLFSPPAWEVAAEATRKRVAAISVNPRIVRFLIKAGYYIFATCV
jgi:hypothetical protein